MRERRVRKVQVLLELRGLMVFAMRLTWIAALYILCGCVISERVSYPTDGISPESHDLATKRKYHIARLQIVECAFDNADGMSSKNSHVTDINVCEGAFQSSEIRRCEQLLPNVFTPDGEPISVRVVHAPRSWRDASALSWTCHILTLCIWPLHVSSEADYTYEVTCHPTEVTCHPTEVTCHPTRRQILALDRISEEWSAIGGISALMPMDDHSGGRFFFHEVRLGAFISSYHPSPAKKRFERTVLVHAIAAALMAMENTGN